MKIYKTLCHDDFPGPEWHFISNEQEVAALALRFDDGEEYRSFFARIENGDFVEVWGMHIAIPRFGHMVFKCL